MTNQNNLIKNIEKFRKSFPSENEWESLSMDQKKSIIAHNVWEMEINFQDFYNKVIKQFFHKNPDMSYATFKLIIKTLKQCANNIAFL